MKKQSKTIEPRAVYVVEYQQTIHQIEMTEGKDLKEELLALLPTLNKKSAQAIAHLADIERVKVTGSDWEVVRAGVMAFQPDADPKEKRPKTSRRRTDPVKAAVVSDPKPSEDPDRLL